MIGGGDSAAEEATCECCRVRAAWEANGRVRVDLTKYGSHVYVLVRRDELRASAIMAKRLKSNPKVVRMLRSVALLGVDASFRPSYGTPWRLNALATATYSAALESRMLKLARRKNSP